MIENQSSMAMIWTSPNRGLVVHLASTGNLECMVTEDGGASWGDPVVMLLANGLDIRHVTVDYYGWYHGAHGFDESMRNQMIIITNSYEYVYYIRVDAESLKVLDSGKKKFPAPIRSVASIILQDGSVRVGIMSALEDEVSVVSLPYINISSPNP